MSIEIVLRVKKKLKVALSYGLEKAIENASLMLLEGALKNQLITLQGRLNDLKKNYRQKQIDYDTYSLHYSQIQQNMLDIIEQMGNENLDLVKATNYLQTN